MELTLGMYHSFGNDYLVYDCMKNSYELKPEDIRNIPVHTFRMKEEEGQPEGRERDGNWL